MRYFQKAMRRAEIPIRYSEGFSPHQIMSFAAPLGMGINGFGEYMDIETVDEKQKSMSSEECVRLLNGVMAEGMKILSYRAIPDDTENAMASVASADYRIIFPKTPTEEETESVKEDIAELLGKESAHVMKVTSKGEKDTDIRPMINELKISDGFIFMNIAQGSNGNLKPQTVIKYFAENGKAAALFSGTGVRIDRTEIYDSGHRRLDEYGNDF